MRPPRVRSTGGLLLVAVALTVPVSLGAQETRAVSGVVVDADTGAPVSGAVVTILGPGLSVVTDPEGRFEISGVPTGSLELVLRHIAYGEHTEALDVEPSGPLDFQIRVSSQAIELAPLGVEVRSREAQAQRASGTATNIIDQATIEAFAPRGLGVLPLLQARIPSLRVHGNCVEYRFLQQALVPDPQFPELVVATPCRDITVYVDGVPDVRGSSILGLLSPQDVEQIQVLSPSEAGLQYIDGGRGVILVETRQGSSRESPYRIHVNGFGWNEPESYPWLQVLGASALGTVAVAGLTSRTVFECSDEDPMLKSPRCHPTAGMAAALVTSAAISRVITRAVGRTDGSEGRTYPALLLGAATASAGYLLYLHGEKQGSDGSRAAGQIVLAVGIPLTLTLSDRVFRMLR